MGVKWMPIGRIECRRLSNSLQRSTVTLAKKAYCLHKKIGNCWKNFVIRPFFFPIANKPVSLLLRPPFGLCAAALDKQFLPPRYEYIFCV